MKERHPIEKVKNFIVNPTEKQAERRAYFWTNLIPDEWVNKMTNNAIDVNRPKIDYPFFPRKKKADILPFERDKK